MEISTSIQILNVWPRSSAWSEHRALNAGVGGSNPLEAIFNSVASVRACEDGRARELKIKVVSHKSGIK